MSEMNRAMEYGRDGSGSGVGVAWGCGQWRWPVACSVGRTVLLHFARVTCKTFLAGNPVTSQHANENYSFCDGGYICYSSP